MHQQSKSNHSITVITEADFFNLKYASSLCYGGLNAQTYFFLEALFLNSASVMTHYSIHSLPICSGKSWSSVSALYSVRATKLSEKSKLLDFRRYTDQNRISLQRRYEIHGFYGENNAFFKKNTIIYTEYYCDYPGLQKYSNLNEN